MITTQRAQYVHAAARRAYGLPIGLKRGNAPPGTNDAHHLSHYQVRVFDVLQYALDPHSIEVIVRKGEPVGVGDAKLKRQCQRSSSRRGLVDQFSACVNGNHAALWRNLCGYVFGISPIPAANLEHALARNEVQLIREFAFDLLSTKLLS